jgi:hypothetical protein
MFLIGHTSTRPVDLPILVSRQMWPRSEAGIGLMHQVHEHMAESLSGFWYGLYRDCRLLVDLAPLALLAVLAPAGRILLTPPPD